MWDKITHVKANAVLAAMLALGALLVLIVLAYFQTNVKNEYACRADNLDAKNEALLKRNDIADQFFVATEKYFDAQDKLTKGFEDNQTNPAKLKEVFADHDKARATLKGERKEIAAERAKIVYPPAALC